MEVLYFVLCIQYNPLKDHSVYRVKCVNGAKECKHVYVVREARSAV